MTFCLSKGLGCPVGSLLCGTADFIHKARRARKMLGGGLRQAGILAAAGLYALDHNIERLSNDHANAQRLSEGIENAEGVKLDTKTVPTNMVYVTTTAPAAQFVMELYDRHKIRCGAFSANRIRFVTHLDVDSQDVDRAIEAICEVGARLTQPAAQR